MVISVEYKENGLEQLSEIEQLFGNIDIESVEQLDDLPPFARLRLMMSMNDISGKLTENKRQEIGQQVHAEFKTDEASNADYYEKIRQIKETDLDMDNKYRSGSNIKLPFLLDAAQDFATHGYPEIKKGEQVLRAQVLNKQDLSAIAERQAAFMNWQNLVENKDWLDQTDIILSNIPTLGCMFRRRGMGREMRQTTRLIEPTELIVNKNVSSLGEAPRVTEKLCFYPYQIEQNIRNGIFRRYDYEGAVGDESHGSDSQKPIDFIEQHTWLDLDDDGLPEPYIVLYDLNRSEVVQIMARFSWPQVIAAKRRMGGIEITDIEPIQHYTMYGYIPDWQGGFYHKGLYHLLGNIQDAANTSLNQILDAGAAYNRGGGFIAGGVGLKAGTQRLGAREYQFLDVMGDDIRRAIVETPVREPSTTLYNVVQYLDEITSRIGMTVQNDLSRLPSNIGEMAALQAMQQGQKVFTKIFQRFYRSLTEEFRTQQLLNAVERPDQKYMKIVGLDGNADPAELEQIDIGIVPAADPNAGIDSIRTLRAQSVVGLLAAQPANPAINVREATKYALKGMEVDSETIEALTTPDPADPMTQKMQMAQIQIQLEQAQLQLQKMQADIVNTNADTVKKQVEAQKTAQEAGKTEYQKAEVIAGTELKLAQAGKAEREARQ